MDSDARESREPERAFTAANDRAAGWITDLTFRKQRWQPEPALVSKSGLAVTAYDGSPYNLDEWDLVPDAWDHDHCFVCWENICEDVESGFPEAYVNAAGQWLCPPCFDHYIGDRAVDSDEREPTSREVRSPGAGRLYVQ